MSNSNNSGSSFGCAGLIVSALVLWAFIFGVSWNGHHYSVECSCADGVVVK